MTEASHETAVDWGIESAQLPERIEGWRVLEIGGGSSEKVLAARGAAEVVALDEPTEALLENGGTFELVHHRAELETALHPLAIGAWLWRLVAPDGILVLGAPVLAEAAHSQYADFQRLDHPARPPWRWVSGRLALRWMVENSGFDVGGWLGERPGSNDGERIVYLQATRVDRLPALDLTRQPLGR